MAQQIPQTGPVKTVLIVEDSDDGLFMLRTLLQLKGYRVTEARDGLDAIEMAVKALTDGTQPPARTLIELKSYPTLERLQVVGALKHKT